jgi:alginate O-acetyltransferase complex protein AlgI
VSLLSWTFLIFVVLVFAAYWAVQPRIRTWVLLAASLVFYAWAFPAYALLLLVLALGSYAVGNKMTSSPDRALLLGWSVSAVVAVLAVFKYSRLAVSTGSAVLSRFGIPAVTLPGFVAPLGISYATFGIINYLVETYRGTVPQVKPAEFALYVFFFPTITSGPIKRYKQFAEDLAVDRRWPDLRDLSAGIGRVAVGVFKKIVIAGLLAVPAAPLTNAPGKQKPLLLLFAVYAYTFMIYFDFSGYSDIAIGISKLFGYGIIENFDHPYWRTNLQQFWRSWHISLTSLIMEYVYIPLGGSRKGKIRTALNTIAAFLVSGLWHGAAWHFMVWGGVHGVGLVIVRLWRSTIAAASERFSWLGRALEHPAGVVLGRVTGWVVTFNFVAFVWVLFAAPTGEALVVYKRIFSLVGLFVLKVVT